MKKVITIFNAIILIVTSTLFSLTYLGSVDGVGDPVLSVTGRALGMGNTYIASSFGVNAVFYNSANMLKGKRGSIGLGFGLYPVKETIESDDEPTRYSSSNYYELSNIAFMYPLRHDIRLGIGRRPVMDFNYDYERNTYSAGELAQTINMDRSGSINKTVIAFAAKLVPAVNIGFSYNIIDGKFDHESSTVTVKNYKNKISADGELKGYTYELGINWELKKDALNIGLTWESGYKIENKWKAKTEGYTWTGTAWPTAPNSTVNVEGKREENSPSKIGLGLSYEFFERERSLLSVDIVRTNWKDYTYKEIKNTADSDFNEKINPRYRNTTRISLGVEHYLGVRTVLRYGFTHMPHYSRTSSDTTMFTVGVGFPASENISVDIAAAYGKRNFYGENIYFTTDEMVDERIAKLQISTVFKF